MPSRLQVSEAGNSGTSEQVQALQRASAKSLGELGHGEARHECKWLYRLCRFRYRPVATRNSRPSCRATWFTVLRRMPVELHPSTVEMRVRIPSAPSLRGRSSMAEHENTFHHLCRRIFFRQRMRPGIPSELWVRIPPCESKTLTWQSTCPPNLSLHGGLPPLF